MEFGFKQAEFNIPRDTYMSFQRQVFCGNQLQTVVPMPQRISMDTPGTKLRRSVTETEELRISINISCSKRRTLTPRQRIHKQSGK